MKVLALDFDGVISNSAREVFVVARTAYLDLRPESGLSGIEEESLFESFLELMPLGNRAEDYGTVLSALDLGLSLPNQEAYDAFRAGQNAEWLSKYHRGFYDARKRFSTEDRDGWESLNRPYAPLLGVLRRRFGDAPYAIATSKDRRSVEMLLTVYGVADLFPDDLIFDKETGEKKVAHLQRIQEKLGVPFAEITFIDDKVNHLDSVAGLGVRCVLAAWGYNGTREHDLALERGYTVCSLEDVEEALFGAG